MTAAFVPLTLDELLLDIALAFPGLDPEPVVEDTPIYPGPKAWFNKQALMPDLCPVFVRPDQLEGREPLGYTHRIHDGFLVWCARRGWNVLAYDGPWFLLVPTATLIAAAEATGAAQQEVHPT